MAVKNKGHQTMDTLLIGALEGANGINQQAQEIANGTLVPDPSLRVQYLNIELVRPDPIQPRRVLPERLHQEFHNERLGAQHALRELVRISQSHARSAGRPFDNPFELLGKLGGEDEESDHWKETPTAPLTPEEQVLFDLVQLAATLQDDGQVNPLTVVNVSQGVTVAYMIETGERRYWATLILLHYHPLRSHDGRIPCIVIPNEKASPFRQAKENTSRAGLNAVAMARQIALLLLHVHGVQLPMGSVTMDFYRQALTLDLRGKREHTEAVYAALGGISKQRFQQYKSLLNLCDEAIEMADRHTIDDVRLRCLIELGPDDQIELLRQIITMGLNVKQIKEIVEKGQINLTNSDDDEPNRLPRSAMQLAKMALKPNAEVDAASIAEAFIGLEKDRNVAKARLKSLREMLEEAEIYIDRI